MRFSAWFFLATASVTAAAAVTASAQTGSAQAASGVVPIVIETTRGVIEADLDSASAPQTVTNFLRYVDAGLYANGTFHRAVRADNQPNDSVRIGVIQGGRAHDVTGFPPIALERTSVTGLRHLDGTLSMARAGPNTATSDFFICIGGQPALDFGGHRNRDGQGFAAFGRVTRGMDIVRAIQQSTVKGQSLVLPIAIVGIRRAVPSGRSSTGQRRAP